MQIIHWIIQKKYVDHNIGADRNVGTGSDLSLQCENTDNEIFTSVDTYALKA